MLAGSAELSEAIERAACELRAARSLVHEYVKAGDGDLCRLCWLSKLVGPHVGIEVKA